MYFKLSYIYIKPSNSSIFSPNLHPSAEGECAALHLPEGCSHCRLFVPFRGEQLSRQPSALSAGLPTAHEQMESCSFHLKTPNSLTMAYSPELSLAFLFVRMKRKSEYYLGYILKEGTKAHSKRHTLLRDGDSDGIGSFCASFGTLITKILLLTIIYEW